MSSFNSENYSNQSENADEVSLFSLNNQSSNVDDGEYFSWSSFFNSTRRRASSASSQDIISSQVQQYNNTMDVHENNNIVLNEESKINNESVSSPESSFDHQMFPSVTESPTSPKTSPKTSPESNGSVGTPVMSEVSIAFSPHQISRLSTHSFSDFMNDGFFFLPASATIFPINKTYFASSMPKYPNQSLNQSPTQSLLQPQLQASTKSQPAASNTSRPSFLRKTVCERSTSVQGPLKRYCHVCRSAKDIKKIVICGSGKQSHVFCESCVHRRLNLSFAVLINSDDWVCPKCDNRCPCSKCRK